MNDITIVKHIHTSDIFGTFIEIGAGQPVAHELFNVSGASKTIYNATSPYSKELQERVFGIAGMRSVSKEAIKKILERADTDPVNTVFVSSFQVADKPESLTHGWFGLRYKETEKYYHITMDDHLERDKAISMIGAIGLRILYCMNDLAQLKALFAKESAMYSCIDIIEDISGTAHIEECLANLDSGLEHPITISKEGKLIRLEDLSRQGNLILLKGSFNPIHNHHIEILKQTEKNYPMGVACFSISLDTFNKGRLDVAQVTERIKMINKLGYPVIVFRKALFSQNVSYLRRSRHNNDCIIMPLGSDTVNRLINYGYNGFKEPGEKGKPNTNVLAFNSHFDNVLFPYMNRPGQPLVIGFDKVPHFKTIGAEESYHSSTNVRELFSNKDYEAIKKLVPVEIYDDILKYLKETHKQNIKSILKAELV